MFLVEVLGTYLVYQVVFRHGKVIIICGLPTVFLCGIQAEIYSAQSMAESEAK